MAYTSYSDIENEALYFDSFEYELACGSPPPREPAPETRSPWEHSESGLTAREDTRYSRDELLSRDGQLNPEPEPAAREDTRPLNPEQEQEQEQLEEAPDEIMFDEEDFNYNPPQEYEPREYPPQPPAPEPRSFEFSLQYTDDARSYKRYMGPRARQKIDKFREINGPDSWLGATFRTPTAHWLSLPLDDPARQAYEDGVTDRLRIGGLGSYWLDETGQTNLDRYVQGIAAKAPGSAESADEAAQLVAEEMERARREGVRFMSSDDMCRFSAELASVYFASIREKPKPRKKREPKPQEARQRLKRYKAYTSRSEARADHQSALDRWVRRQDSQSMETLGEPQEQDQEEDEE